MVGDYISREAATAELCKRCADAVMCTRSDDDCPIKKGLNAIPAADVVEVVRCRECKYRIVNEHFGEKGYIRRNKNELQPYESNRYHDEPA